MSRTSTLTPRRPRAAKMRPLHVAIYDNGKLSHIMEVADPRKILCEEFERQGAEFGMSAKPITPLDALLLNRKLAAQGKAVTHA
jgi:hypothetical protein